MHMHLYLQYVDELLATLVSFRPELEDLLQQLQDQVHLTAQASEAEAAKFTGTTKAASAARKQTVPEPFNLTQPKPKLQPLEEPLPPPVKCGLQRDPSANSPLAMLHSSLGFSCNELSDTMCAGM